MGRKTILVGIDGDSVHSQLVGGPEHSDSDFLAKQDHIREEIERRASKSAYSTVRYKDLGQRSAMPSGLPAHCLDAMHRCARRTGRRNKGVGQPRGVEGLWGGSHSDGRESREPKTKKWI